MVFAAINKWHHWYADMGVDEAYLAYENHSSSSEHEIKAISNNVKHDDLSTGLNAIREEILDLAKQTNCPLQKSAKHFLFHRGNYLSNLMIISDIPNNIDDVNGQILSGDDGKLLANMLSSIGLDIDKDSYIAPIIPFRPPGGRPITEHEWERYIKFTGKQLYSLKPKVVLMLGKETVQQLLPNQSKGSILKLNNNIISQNTYSDINILPIFHPRFLISSQKHKSLAWETIKTLEKLL